MVKLKSWKLQYPYPILDWEVETGYSKLEEITPKEWAWEFLRRNEDYQYDYDRWVNNEEFPEFRLIDQHEMSLSKQKSLEDEMKFFGFSIEYADSLIAKENIDSLFYRQVLTDDGNKIPIKDALLKKYGLWIGSTLHDPKKPLPNNNFFDLYREGLSTLHFNPSPKGDRYSIAPEIPEQIVIRFNARHSIPDQKKHLEKCLKEIQRRLNLPKIRNKPSSRALIDYVRALDSEASKARKRFSVKEIVKKIHNIEGTSNSPNKTHATWLEKGLELSKKEYLSLLEGNNK